MAKFWTNQASQFRYASVKTFSNLLLSFMVHFICLLLIRTVLRVWHICKRFDFVRFQFHFFVLKVWTFPTSLFLLLLLSHDKAALFPLFISTSLWRHTHLSLSISTGSFLLFVPRRKAECCRIFFLSSVRIILQNYLSFSILLVPGFCCRIGQCCHSDITGGASDSAGYEMFLEFSL